MGRRDFRKRETKKSKRTAKTISADAVLPPPASVEVVKQKGKKEPKEE